VTERVLGGRYRIVRHVAKGGMAEVYLGHDQLLDRPVAVKVLVPDLAQDATFVERFRREAQAAAGLNHHNIVSVYDFGQDDGAHFIVMEYVDGPTLRDIIRREAPLAPAKVIEIGAEIAAGLAAAHQQGIVHRDMKPANVLMTESGNVKVADFGIARAAQSAREGLTMPGAVVGTATYLSPEQALGEPLDHRSDLYSLGMVLYEMLAGRPTFTGDSPVAVAYKQVNETPPPPSVYNADVPPALDAIVMRAMAKNPAQRQPSAEGLRADLLAVKFASTDPEPTVASAGQMAGAAGPASATVLDPGLADATAVAAGPATSMLPPPTGVDVGGGRPVAPPPGPYRGERPDPGVYRRRRAAILALVLVAAVAAIALASTLGGGGGKQTVTVPGVVGKGVNDAVTELGRVGLQPDIQIDDQLDGAPDRVAQQDPPAGATAKKGDKVKLVLPTGSTETTTTTTPTTQAPAATPPPTVAQTAPPTTRAPATTVATVAPTTSPPTTEPPTTVVVTTTAPSPPST
jgi:serine/threonine-protein kinase